MSQQDENCTLLVFNYMKMSTSYGAQAFRAIYAVLADSRGVIAFFDGDLDCDEICRLARTATRVHPSDGTSPLASLSSQGDYGDSLAYIAAMWTDTPDNAEKLHRGLIAAGTPGYLGCLTLPGNLDFADFQSLSMRRLSLPQSIFLRDGTVVKGTSKYGIGWRQIDGELLAAALHNDADGARNAIVRGADVDCIHWCEKITPLVRAADMGHVEVVRTLLEHGANPNSYVGPGNSALMLAAYHGHIEIVKLLILAGVDVNAGDMNGSTALDSAEKHPEIQRLIREAGGRGRR